MKQNIEKMTHIQNQIENFFPFRKTNLAFCIKERKKKKLLCKAYVNKLNNVEQMSKFLDFLVSIKKKKSRETWIAYNQ